MQQPIMIPNNQPPVKTKGPGAMGNAMSKMGLGGG